MTQTRPNWALLGAARFFLAFVVVADHFACQYAVAGLMPFGRFFNSTAAVRAFLLISGFSIAHSITSRPDGYGQRRVERIYPTYLIAILMTMAVAAMGWVNPPEPFQLLASLLMLQTFAAHSLPGIGQSWTLSIECAFYALAPWLRRLSPRWIVGLFCASGALFYSHAPSHAPEYVTMLGLVPALALLCWWLGGWIIYLGSERARQAALWGIVFLSATEGAVESRGAAVMVIAVMFLLMHSQRVTLPAWAKRLAIYAGDVSYPLYLTHGLAAAVVSANTVTPNPWFYCGAALATAIAVLHLEQGIKWLRRLRVPKPARSPERLGLQPQSGPLLSPCQPIHHPAAPE